MEATPKEQCALPNDYLFFAAKGSALLLSVTPSAHIYDTCASVSWVPGGHLTLIAYARQHTGRWAAGRGPRPPRTTESPKVRVRIRADCS